MKDKQQLREWWIALMISVVVWSIVMVYLAYEFSVAVPAF